MMAREGEGGGARESVVGPIWNKDTCTCVWWVGVAAAKDEPYASFAAKTAKELLDALHLLAKLTSSKAD
jgi:hypothetical protein